jgi:hypothetical protein
MPQLICEVIKNRHNFAITYCPDCGTISFSAFRVVGKVEVLDRCRATERDDKIQLCHPGDILGEDIFRNFVNAISRMLGAAYRLDEDVAKGFTRFRILF